MTAGWSPAPDDLALGDDEVHVWRVSLVQPAPVLARLAAALDGAERDRAARFHFARDRDAFTVARGVLRTLAGRYLACPPAELVFGYRDHGKPYLCAPPGAELGFNVSHSGGLAVLGFARGRELGVDVELRRSLDDVLALARIAFSPAEYAALGALPPEHRTPAFFACWSRKEAFIKATGEGIRQVAEFDVSLAPGEPARLLRAPGGVPRWSLRDLPAIPGYAAAIVLDGPALPIACWDWSPGDR